MQVQISVKDDKAELFLQILQEFKSDMIEKFQVLKVNSQEDLKSKEFFNNKLYFHKCLDDIENNNTELVSSENYKKEMQIFTEKLKLNYANN